MSAHRLALLVLVAAVSGSALAACSSSGNNPSSSNGGDSSSTTGQGGAGGAGGAAGAGGAGSTTTSTGTGGSGPIDCGDPSNYTNIAVGDCDLFKQDCTVGYSCVPTAGGPSGAISACALGSGLKGIGKSCNDLFECEPGMFCANHQCSPVCCKQHENEICGGGSCNLQLNFAPSGPAQYALVCSFGKSCQLFTDNACPAGQDCHLQDPSQGLAVCINPSGMQVPEGGACQFLNSCGNMQVCANGFCRYSCSPTDWASLTPGKGGCPDGQACFTYQDAPTSGACQPKP